MYDASLEFAVRFPPHAFSGTPIHVDGDSSGQPPGVRGIFDWVRESGPWVRVVSASARIELGRAAKSYERRSDTPVG